MAGRETITQRASLRGYFVTALALAMLALPFAFNGRPWFDTLSVTFVAIVLEAMPFMLLGAVIAGLLEVYLPATFLPRLFAKRPWLAIVPAAASGLAFPICECGIVPVIRRLTQKGLPPGAAIAYLLGAPIVNPIVFASTVVAYGMQWQPATLRLLLGYTIALIAGLLFQLVHHRGLALFATTEPLHPCPTCPTNPTSPTGPPPNLLSTLATALRHAAAEFLATGPYLIVGAFAAALAQTLLPRALLAGAAAPLAAIPAMMLLAILLNLCSEADAFVAASFAPAGIPFSAQLAFLLLGPMFDLKLLAMFPALLRRRAILLLIATVTTLTFTAALLVEAFL